MCMHTGRLSRQMPGLEPTTYVLSRDWCEQPFGKPLREESPHVLMVIAPHRNAEVNKCSLVVVLDSGAKPGSGAWMNLISLIPGWGGIGGADLYTSMSHAR